jgi:hypothetical protein
MPLQETQTSGPGAKAIAGGTIGATAGMQGAYALKELMKDEAHSWGRHFKDKPIRRAVLGAGITAGGFLGGLAAGSRFEKRKSREAQTLLKQSGLEKNDVIGAGSGAVKGLAATKLYELYKKQNVSKKRLAAMGIIGAGEGLAASNVFKKVRHGRND